LDIRKTFFYSKSNRLSREAMDVISLEMILGQAGPGSEQPDLAVDVPVHCRGVVLDDP